MGREEHILVKFKEEELAEKIKESIKNGHSIKKVYTRKKLKYTRAELLQVDEDDDLSRVIEELKNHNGVHYAQEDHKLYSCNAYEPEKFKAQWGLFNCGQVDTFGNMGEDGIDIGVVSAWQITRGCECVKVAVLDTGIDINHLDLKSSIYYNMLELAGNGIDDDGNNYCDDITGWDFINKDNSVYHSIDDDTHGTLVAGIIAAKGDDAGIIGVAPNVKLIPLKFMSKEHGYTSAAIEAIEYAKKMDVKIVNCSWGDYNDNDALKHHMLESGMLFVCAAGNDGIDLVEKPFYPACFDLPNVIAVAAVNNKGKLWPLSNYGERIHVAAPGVSILSTIPSIDEKGYMSKCGTSMATPHVTGIAALLMSVDKSLSPEQIKQRIEQSVTPLTDLKGKLKSGGIVNAHKALMG